MKQALNDHFFNSLTSAEFSNHDEIHWSKFAIIKEVVSFLEKNNAKNVLDIGSGIGKFCLLGSMLSKIEFTGVEIRSSLHKESLRIKKLLNTSSVNFIQDDIKNVDFSPFDAFYYYNPFCEHIATKDIIDDCIELSEEKFYEYEDIIINKLDDLKIGTLVILHYTKTLFLSENYQLIDILADGELTYWRKIK